jgi:Holliday junction resolvase
MISESFWREALAGKASRDKGARREREFAELLREYGFEAHRGRQYHGGPGSPDVVSDVPGVHFEVKGVEKLNLHAALDQAIGDCDGTIPIVAFKKSRRDWVAILRMSDMLNILVEKNERDSANRDCWHD